MTNYNKRLDEIVQKFALNQQLIGDQYGRDQINELSFELKDSEYRDEAKQALTSLIKELVAEAKPRKKHVGDEVAENRSYTGERLFNAAIDEYHTNILKALEEK